MKNISKISKVFLEILNNFPKFFTKPFKIYFKNFQNLSIYIPLKDFQYLSKFFHEIILEILLNNVWNLPTFFFLKIFKNFDNISCNFLKYFSKFSKIIVQIFRNDLILTIFLNNLENFRSIFQNSLNIFEIFFKIFKYDFYFCFKQPFSSNIWSQIWVCLWFTKPQSFPCRGNGSNATFFWKFSTSDQLRPLLIFQKGCFSRSHIWIVYIQCCSI